MLFLRLRHRLLPQAGGIKSFGLAPEGAPPDRPLITPLVGQPHRPFNRRAAARALPANASARERRPVSEAACFVDLGPEIRENRKRLFPPAPDTGMAPVGLASLDPNLVRGELDFGVHQRKIGAEVASVEGVDGPVREV